MNTVPAMNWNVNDKLRNMINKSLKEFNFFSSDFIDMLEINVDRSFKNSTIGWECIFPEVHISSIMLTGLSDLSY